MSPQPAMDRRQPADQVNLQLCPMFPHSPLFRAMPFADKAIAAVQQLIGDPVVLHLDQVFLKPGKQGSGTNWHQDNAYFQIDDPLKGTAMWTAVHDATVANGTIHVIPGSFRTVYPHSRDPYKRPPHPLLSARRRSAGHRAAGGWRGFLRLWRGALHACEYD